jgi:hypothetical protein
MTLSGIRLKQSLSARVASTGLQSSILVGGSTSASLNSSHADIIYGFSLKSGHANNEVKWSLKEHTLEQLEASTAPTCTESVGATGTPASILDADGNSISNAVTALAIYYEIPADVTTGSFVKATSTADQFSTIKLVGNTSDSAVRSVLMSCRTACGTDSVTFTFGGTDGAGVKVNVVYLANTT